MLYKGSFIADNQIEYTVEIDTGGSGTTELLLARDAVTIEVDSDGLFAPLKAKTATITFVGKDYYFDMYSPSPTGVTAKVYTDDTVLFDGYATPAVYSQEWKMVSSVSLECVDKISVLQYFDYAPNTGYTRSIKVLRDIIGKCLGYIGNCNFYFPQTYGLVNGDTTIKSDVISHIYLNEENFFDDDDENTPWKASDLLEEICNTFGLSLIWDNGNYIFLDYQGLVKGNTTYDGYAVSSSTASYTGTRNFSSTYTITKEAYADSSNSIDAEEVYNKITVSCNTYEPEDLTTDEDVMSAETETIDYGNVITSTAKLTTDWILVSFTDSDGDKHSYKIRTLTYNPSSICKLSYAHKKLTLLGYEIDDTVTSVDDTYNGYTISWANTGTKLQKISTYDPDDPPQKIEYDNYYTMSLGIPLFYYKDNEMSATNYINYYNTQYGTANLYPAYTYDSDSGTYNSLGWHGMLLTDANFLVSANANLPAMTITGSNISSPSEGDTEWIVFSGSIMWCNTLGWLPVDDLKEVKQSKSKSTLKSEGTYGFGGLRVKVSIGDKTYNYNTKSWEVEGDSDSVYYLTLPIGNEDEGNIVAYWNGFNDIVTNYDYTWGIDSSEDGFAIPISSSDNVSGQIKITIYAPEFPYDMSKSSDENKYNFSVDSVLTTNSDNSYKRLVKGDVPQIAYIKDFKATLCHSTDWTAESVASDEDEDEDIIYENKIDDSYALEFDEIELKINTQVSDRDLSYSSMYDNVNASGEVTLNDGFYDVVNGVTRIQEKNLIEKYYNHYSSMKLVFEASLLGQDNDNNQLQAYSICEHPYLNRNFIVDSYSWNLRSDKYEATLIEF